MEADFSGYATKAGLKCSDGRTIMPDAFKHQDNMKVPLVWQHGHNDPENVLGHALLENRDDGVYAHGYFNMSGKAAHARGLVEHGDITMLSIWANDLIERTGRVLHGAIREVSLVLSGANPGAVIENVTIRHSDGDEITLDDEVIIYTGLEIEHTSGDDDADDTDDVDEELEVITHADSNADTADDETVEDIYNSMTEKQKTVLHFMVGQALAEAQNSEPVQQDNMNDTREELDQEGSEMTRNVFEQGDEKTGAARTGAVLSHADIQGIVADATKSGSLKDAVEAYAISHGINDIDVLFPDAQALDSTPEFLSRRTEWVSNILTGTRKSPFSRIKTLSADITLDEARAKGYVTGAMKKEEFFGVAKRITTPTTVYKKQKLDRDDMIDITDFDVVAWLKGEMRLMLDEEVARAILIGDGRDIAHEDKINEGNIRPIAKDHDLYTTVVNVNIDDANSSVQEVIDALILNRRYYKGTGLPTMYTTETYISKFLLLKDTLGRRIYNSLTDIATELRVTEIVPVEVMEEDPTTVAVLVNPADYVCGATRGGEVSLFDDFDIDYNQYKYLIETRMCGALTKLKSAIVVKKTAASSVLVTPVEPVWNSAAHTFNIPSPITGVEYRKDGVVVTAATNPQTVAAGTTVVVTATATTGYHFATNQEDQWSYSNP